MTGPRIAFDRPDRTCAACAVDLKDGAGASTWRCELTEPATELELCGDCRARILADGVAPAPFVPAFEFDGAFRLPVVTADDLRTLLGAVAKLARPDGPESELADLLDRSEHPRLAEHEAWEERLRRPSRRPDALDLAGVLVTGALLGIEPAPVDALSALVVRANGPDELAACFGAYCARAAGVELWRPCADKLSGRAQRLLEQAERSLLLGTLPSSHPHSTRVTQIRIGIALAMDRGPIADGLLDRIGRDDPRSQLLRGLRFAQQDHLGAADREFRAATDNPFAGFDPEIDGAAIWNRTARALAATRFDEARGALRAYCKLRPDDLGARLVLGHAYARCSLDTVAREVLASVLDADALAHLRGIAEDPGLDATARVEGVLLYASCLLRIGEPHEARRLLEAALDAGDETDPRRAEVLRLAARCALAEGVAELALEQLGVAWPLDRSPAAAHEVASAAGAALRDRLELHGLPGLFTLLERHPWLGGALRKRFGPMHALLLATFAQQQVRGGFLPRAGFGLDWSWIGARGANARSSTFQAYACLARHQVVTALQHDLEAQGAGGPGVPLGTLSALFAASRRATDDERDNLIHLLGQVVQQALRDLGR